MKIFGIENGKTYILRGGAAYSLEAQLTGNGTTKNFIVSIPEKVSYPHVTVYLMSGTTATRVKDTVYTAVVNQSLPNQLQLNFSTAPANNAVYKIFITNTQF